METIGSNWTRWQTVPSPEDEYWFWEKISPEFWFWLRDTLYWFPSFCVITYWSGIYLLYFYMQSKSKPANVKGNKILYNALVSLAAWFILYKTINHTSYPNLLTLEGLHTILCVRIPMKNIMVSYTGITIWFKLVHFLDTVFVVLEKRPPPTLQMVHHSVAVMLPTLMSQYEEPYFVTLGLLVSSHHCFVYPICTLKACGIKFPKFVSTFLLTMEGVIAILFCCASSYAGHVIKNGGECVRHPTSGFACTLGGILMSVYVAKEFVHKYMLRNKTKTE